MEPVTVVCSAACTVTHVISVPPFDLDTEASGQIAVAVLAIWAVGFAFRALIRTLNNTDAYPSESEQS